MTNAELIKALLYCVSDDIMDCDECPYNGKYRCRDLQAQAAADALEEADKRIAELERILKAVQENSGINFRMWQEAEAQLPKEGKWIHVEGDEPWEWTCTACHKIAEGLGEFRYCPNCGARMKGEQK